MLNTRKCLLLGASALIGAAAVAGQATPNIRGQHAQNGARGLQVEDDARWPGGVGDGEVVIDVVNTIGRKEDAPAKADVKQAAEGSTGTGKLRRAQVEDVDRWPGGVGDGEIIIDIVNTIGRKEDAPAKADIEEASEASSGPGKSRRAQVEDDARWPGGVGDGEVLIDVVNTIGRKEDAPAKADVKQAAEGGKARRAQVEDVDRWPGGVGDGEIIIDIVNTIGRKEDAPAKADIEKASEASSGPGKSRRAQVEDDARWPGGVGDGEVLIDVVNTIGRKEDPPAKADVKQAAEGGKARRAQVEDVDRWPGGVGDGEIIIDIVNTIGRKDDAPANADIKKASEASPESRQQP